MSKYGSEFGIDIPEDAYDDTAFANQYATQTPAYDDTEFANLYATQPENSNVTYADEYHKGVGGGSSSYSSVGVDPSKLDDPTKGFDFSKFLSNLKGQFGGLGQKVQDNPLQSLLFAALAARALTGGNRPTSSGGYTGPGINMGLKATRSPIAPINYKPYSGQPIYGPSDSSQVTYAAGGGLMGLAGGGMSKRPRYLRGNTDGMADKIDTSIDDREPAKLSHGEFVIPADVVSHLGNGNSDAGADVLYKMMDKVRMARTGRKSQGKKINPSKFMPGGAVEDAKYVDGGQVQRFQTGGTTTTTTTPTGSTTAQNLSAWAGPYVTDYLSKGQALANTPYQSFSDFYKGKVPLTAGTSDLQQTAYQGLKSLVGGFGSTYGTSYGGGYQPPADDFIDQVAARGPSGGGDMGLMAPPPAPGSGRGPDIGEPGRTYPVERPVDRTQVPPQGAGYPSQYDTATNFATQAGQTAQQAKYDQQNVYAPLLTQYQMQQPQDVTGQTFGGATLGAAPQATAQTGMAATTGAAPTMQAQEAQAAQLGPATQGIAALGTAAQAGVAPTFSGAQFQAPGQIGYQTVAGERVNAPTLRDLSMQAATSNYRPDLLMYQMEAPTPIQAAAAQVASLGAAPTMEAARLGEAPEMTAARLAASPEAKAALTDYVAKLQNYQMGPAERVGTQSILEGPGVGAYMSPYMQNVVDRQQAAAQRQADIQAQARKAQFGQSGAFGGGRFGIENAQANAALLRQQGDIQAQGLQAAYQQGQQQFNAEQQAKMQAALANQQAGLTVGQQNLAANLGVQQLGTQTGLQAALANQQAQQQVALANQALAGQYGLQQGQFEQAAAAANQAMKGQFGLTQGQFEQAARQANQQMAGQYGITGAQLAQQAYNTNAQLAQQAALANQQAEYNAAQQNLAAALGVQNLGANLGQQMELANLSNTQQANAQNLAAALQTQQLGAQTSMQAQQLNQATGLQAALANQQAGINTGQFNAQMGYNTALQNAQLAQQAGLANQQVDAQFGLANLGNQQQMAMANLANQQAVNAANQQAANQFALTQGQFGQQANLQTAAQAQQAAAANQALQGQYGLTNAQMAQQMGLANLGNQQQTALANQALAGQFGLTQGQFGQQAGMQNAQLAQQAALANQQAGLTTGQQNLAARLGVQNLAAQQNLQAQLANQQAGQFGANFGLQANQQQLAAAQALAGIGQGQFGTQLAGLQALLGAGTQQQQTEQAGIAALQNEYNKQMMYPYQQLQFQQGLLSGLPVAAATNTPNTSPLSQLYGGASDLLGLYKLLGGVIKP